VTREITVEKGPSLDTDLYLDNIVHFHSCIREHPAQEKERQLGRLDDEYAAEADDWGQKTSW